jgi:hypothetical protein
MLIDFSVLIAWERDQRDIETALAGHADEDFAIRQSLPPNYSTGCIAPRHQPSEVNEKLLSKAF